MNDRASRLLRVRLLRVRLLKIAPVLAVVAACAGTNHEIPDDSGVQTVAGSGHSSHPPSAGPSSDPVSAPAQLVGLDAEELDRLLGPADFTRSDGPAEIRQYRDSGCVLDLFLYADLASGRYRVSHVEARDRQTAGIAEQACVAGLLRSRQAG